MNPGPSRTALLRARVIAAAREERTPLAAVLAALEFVDGVRALTRVQALNALCLLHEQGLFELHACAPGARPARLEVLRGTGGQRFDRLTLRASPEPPPERCPLRERTAPGCDRPDR